MSARAHPHPSSDPHRSPQARRTLALPLALPLTLCLTLTSCGGASNSAAGGAGGAGGASGGLPAWVLTPPLGCGVGSARAGATARSAALARGRDDLARRLRTHITSMILTAYGEGARGRGREEGLRVVVAQTDLTLNGVTPREERAVTEGEVETRYLLMCVSREEVLTALDDLSARLPEPEPTPASSEQVAPAPPASPLASPLARPLPPPRDRAELRARLRAQAEEALRELGGP